MLDAPLPTFPRIECTQFALEALLDAQRVATRDASLRVTPAHVLVGLIRQRRSSAGELLANTELTEDRIWAAFDTNGQRTRRRGLRCRLPGAGLRWTHAAREVVSSAMRECAHRDTAVVDTVDLLGAVGDAGDPLTAHVLDLARIEATELGVREAHLVELERSPTTQLPSFNDLRKLLA